MGKREESFVSIKHSLIGCGWVMSVRADEHGQPVEVPEECPYTNCPDPTNKEAWIVI